MLLIVDVGARPDGPAIALLTGNSSLRLRGCGFLQSLDVDFPPLALDPPAAFVEPATTQTDKPDILSFQDVDEIQIDSHLPLYL